MGRYASFETSCTMRRLYIAVLYRTWSMNGIVQNVYCLAMCAGIIRNSLSVDLSGTARLLTSCKTSNDWHKGQQFAIDANGIVSSLAALQRSQFKHIADGHRAVAISGWVLLRRKLVARCRAQSLGLHLCHSTCRISSTRFNLRALLHGSIVALHEPGRWNK
jgi:hypothetical protein